MKKIKKLDLRLEKEVISTLSAGDLSGMKGGASTINSNGVLQCCIINTVVTGCQPVSDGCTKTQAQTECLACPGNSVKTCLLPFTNHAASCEICGKVTDKPGCGVYSDMQYCLIK